MNLGADDYLTKPCSPEDILSAIATRLEKQANYTQQQIQHLSDNPKA